MSTRLERAGKGTTLQSRATGSTTLTRDEAGGARLEDTSGPAPSRSFRERYDTDYVMDTFPLVRKNDEKVDGEYRTKRVILKICDALEEAAQTGKPYQTRFDPPPSGPRVAHPDRRPAAEKRAE